MLVCMYVCVHVCARVCMCVCMCVCSSDKCLWLLSTVEAGQVVEVEVTDIELEAAANDDDGDCPDYLAVYDGERVQGAGPTVLNKIIW